MYFPSDMNFQYFFFSTYPGFFLQALPIALIAGIIYVARQIRRGRRCSTGRIILSSLFVCYITGLLCLTLLNSIIGDIYYFLFYHAPSGRSHHWFTFEYDFIPDFFHNFGAENLGNIVMFLPLWHPLPAVQTEQHMETDVNYWICDYIGDRAAATCIWPQL